MRTVIATLVAAGIECLVVGVARKNATQDLTGWLPTTLALRRAADAGGAAFLDLRSLYLDAALGTIPATAGDVCGTNRINHPGPVEHRAIGRQLARLLID